MGDMGIGRKPKTKGFLTHSKGTNTETLKRQRLRQEGDQEPV
jgi:hypothetical protein